MSFEATPSASPSNTVIGNAVPADYTGLTIAVRFNPTGSIDARNGGTYVAATTVAYSANTRYCFRIVINLVAHTYSVYVTPQAASEILIVSNYAFRSEQANVNNLNTLATVVSGTGFVPTIRQRSSLVVGNRRWSAITMGVCNIPAIVPKTEFPNNASAVSNIKLINRGDYGTSHGWGNVHSVIWNYVVLPIFTAAA